MNNNLMLVLMSLLLLTGTGCSDSGSSTDSLPDPLSNSVDASTDAGASSSTNSGQASAQTSAQNTDTDSSVVASNGDDSNSPTTADSDTPSTAIPSTEQGGVDDTIVSAGAASPNFLFIISDDQGLDASAQYSVGQDLPNTPVINALADTGIIFDNAWATPSCTTTRGSIISGQHGVNSGVDTTPSLMDTNTLTLQRFLRSSEQTADYATAVVGKWHLAGGNTTNNLLHPIDSGVGYYAGNIAGVVDDYSSWPLTEDGVTNTSDVYHTTKVTDIAIDWVEQQANPWFMWLAYVAPHSPFHLPPADLHTQQLSGDANDIRTNPRAYYLAAIEAMDTEIGRLLDSLDEETRDNTLIVFIGDNGTPRNVIDSNVYDSNKAKGSLYEGGIRVPMVVAGHGVTRINEREAALVNTVDLYATVTEAAGLSAPAQIDGQSFFNLLQDATAPSREFNYSEFISSNTDGWAVRDDKYKLIEFADGSRELYDLESDQREAVNLIGNSQQFSAEIAKLDAYAAQVRSGGGNVTTDGPVDISNATLTNQSLVCSDYVNTYTSSSLDVQNNASYNGNLAISSDGANCVFTTNAIPNHDFNDGSRSFPNAVSEQSVIYSVPVSPQIAASTTALSLTVDNAILLNGVKVDILAAGCFGVGDGRIGCNDDNQPWRFDPAFPAAGFLIDSHNAHTQPDGTYHYHAEPNALSSSEELVESPVIGFAADGFPIFGTFISDNGRTREIQPSYRLKTGARPTGAGQPGGTYDGTYRDDYEYVSGLGDLDECNGRVVNGEYRYHTTKDFPYLMACYRGTPDASFSKGR